MVKDASAALDAALANVVITATTKEGDSYEFRTDKYGYATVFVPDDYSNVGDAKVEFSFGDYVPRTIDFDKLPGTVVLDKSWITSVTPSGPGVSLSESELVITFKEAMDTSNTDSDADKVLLNGSPLQKSSKGWDADKTVTYDLPTLSYGTTYNISIGGFKLAGGGKKMLYADETYWFSTVPAPAPPYIPITQPPTNPTPPPDPANPTLTMTSGDLDALFQNSPDGVMLLVVGGNLDSLQLDVPLSWFMENLGATLLVYNEGLGLLAITSENMIELAAQVYNGEEGGITVTINGKEVTFLPETIMSYVMVRGSISLTVTADGNSMKWYVYDSPLVLGIPQGELEVVDENLLVAYTIAADGVKRIIPRSIVKDGIVYLLVNNEGRFDIEYNRVEFSDIAGGWMEEAVRFVAAREIMNGVGEGRFDPRGELTRAQFVTMLMRMLDYEMSGYDTAPFIDIEPGSWYYDSVCKAAALGIAGGVGDGLFAPDAPISREDIFTMTYRALVKFYVIIPELSGAEPGELSAMYSDAEDISGYAAEAVSELVYAGIVGGDNARIWPQRVMNRGEAAQFMANIIEFVVPDYGDKLK